jgi:large subunit ribosomal protein L35Ae
MQGIIHSFKRGRRTQTTNQMIVIVKGVEKKEKASEFVGKKVVWKSPAGKEINGEVRSAHGNSGALRVLFEKGMPGQAIGDKVNIL